jgi:hypothetical protein
LHIKSTSKKLWVSSSEESNHYWYQIVDYGQTEGDPYGQTIQVEADQIISALKEQLHKLHFNN